MVRSPCVGCETGETGVGGKNATHAVIFPLFVVYFRCNIKKNDNKAAAQGMGIGGVDESRGGFLTPMRGRTD